MLRFLSRWRAFHRDERGQAMLETAILLPALLALFLGLWHHVLLQQAQTRSLLAARHVAWASSYLHESNARAKARASAFFPAGTTLETTAKGIESKNDARNFAAWAAALVAEPDEGMEWSEGTVQATVPALPAAAPLPPGRGAAGEERSFLAEIKTHPETCYAVNRSPDTEVYFLKALVLPLFRLDRVAATALPNFLKQTLLKAISKAVTPEGAGDETKALIGVVLDLVAGGLERIFGAIFD